MAQDWTPVWTAGIGAVAVLAGAFGNGAIQRRRERDARREERQAVREAEIDAFEREQVQRLQEKLLALVKVSNAINATRTETWRAEKRRAEKRWPSIPETGRAEEYASARFDAIALSERMLVPALKDGGWAVINQVAKLMNASADTVDTAEIDVSLKMSETMKLLGARLGELYRRPT